MRDPQPLASPTEGNQAGQSMVTPAERKTVTIMNEPNDAAS